MICNNMNKKLIKKRLHFLKFPKHVYSLFQSLINQHFAIIVIIVLGHFTQS